MRNKQHDIATTNFKIKVRSWAEKIRVKPGQIRIQRMKRKWASCSTNRWITFSEDLLHEPAAFQDYVIVHELLHLRVPNHGKLFKSLLDVYVPGFCSAQRELPRRLSDS